MLAYIPNLLTVLRLALVPVFIVVVYEQDYGNALLIFIFAGMTDGADGFIAKRFDCESRLGALLDPVADKCLLMSAYGMLTWLGAIPFWLTVTVIFQGCAYSRGLYYRAGHVWRLEGTADPDQQAQYADADCPGCDGPVRDGRLVVDRALAVAVVNDCVAYNGRQWVAVFVDMGIASG